MNSLKDFMLGGGVGRKTSFPEEVKWKIITGKLQVCKITGNQDVSAKLSQTV